MEQNVAFVIKNTDSTILKVFTLHTSNSIKTYILLIKYFLNKRRFNTWEQYFGNISFYLFIDLFFCKFLFNILQNA